MANIRNFDNHNRYLDNDGNILHGKIEFFYKDGLTDATIYDSDETMIDNPQYTDIHGRTVNQVFLESGKEILVYFYKYIGGGDMTVDGNPDNWVLQYTVESINAFSTDFLFETLTTVPDIESLRNKNIDNVTEQADGSKFIVLLGYNESGDCEPIYYKWDATSYDNDDGGSVIQPYGMQTGRWIMIPTSGTMDCRHFGIFPKDSLYDETDDTTQLRRLFVYCNKKGLNPEIMGEDQYRYINVTNAVLTSVNTIRVSNYTRIRFTGTNVISAEFEGTTGTLFIPSEEGAGKMTLQSDVVYTGWDGGQVTTNNAKTVYINKMPILDTEFNNQTIYITATNGLHDLIFKNCNIVDCNHLIGAGSSNNQFFHMENMEIMADWFDSDYDFTKLDIKNCKILLENIKDANLYIKLKNKQLDYNYGSLNEMTITDAELGANCILEDCDGSAKIKGSGDSTCELHNASITLTVTNGSSMTINAVDCWMTLNTDVIKGLYMRRGNLSSSSAIQILDNCYMNNVGIASDLKCYGLDECTFEDCNIYSVIDFIGHNNIVVDGCTFEANSRFDYKVNSNSAFGIFNNNRFKRTSKGLTYKSLSTGRDCYLNITWTCNHSDMDTHFINIDRTNIAEADNLHKYIYQNNTGANVLQQHTEQVVTGYVEDGMFTSQQSKPWQENALFILAGVRHGRSDDYNLWEGVWWNYWNRTEDGEKKGLWLSSKVFMVGEKGLATIDFVQASITGFSAYVTINNKDWKFNTNSAYTELNVDENGGYNYYIKPPKDAMCFSLGGGNLSTPYMDPQLFRFVLKTDVFRT